jgi:hypothetical protein
LGNCWARHWQWLIDLEREQCLSKQEVLELLSFSLAERIKLLYAPKDDLPQPEDVKSEKRPQD